jgi:hypothetical protein
VLGNLDDRQVSDESFPPTNGTRFGNNGRPVVFLATPPATMLRTRSVTRRSHMGPLDEPSPLGGSATTSQRCFVEEVPTEMPRYFFHVKSGQLTVLDREGVELADIANAVKEAAQRAQEIVLKDVLQGVCAVSRLIIIADDEWRTVTELPF